MRDQAQVARAQELQLRRDQVEARFAKSRATLLEHQKVDLRILNDKLIQDLQAVAKHFEMSSAAAEKTFIAALRGIQQKALVSAIDVHQTPEEKKMISDAINRTWGQRVKDVSGMELTPSAAAPIPKAASRAGPSRLSLRGGSKLANRHPSTDQVGIVQDGDQAQADPI
jgi:hypothetical protein